ncbi:hypothetical protein ACS0PU_005217 [Formica fusca]
MPVAATTTTTGQREKRNGGKTGPNGNGQVEEENVRWKKKAASRSSGRFATRLKSCHTPPVARLRQVNAHTLRHLLRKKQRQLYGSFFALSAYAESITRIR